MSIENCSGILLTLGKSDILKLNKINSLKKGKVKLILTSPPYPGIHISYNKWQLHGRRDTKLPYWIMNSRPPVLTKFTYRGEKSRRHHANRDRAKTATESEANTEETTES